MSGDWTCYRHAAYREPYRAVLPPGTIPWVQDVGIRNDDLSSLEVRRLPGGLAGRVTLWIDHERTPDPIERDVTLGLSFNAGRSQVRIDTTSELVSDPFETPLGENRVRVSLVEKEQGPFDRGTGRVETRVRLLFDHNLPVLGDSHVTFALTTGTAQSPGGRFTENGAPFQPATGQVRLVGASRFDGGFLGDRACSVVIEGVMRLPT